MKYVCFWGACVCQTRRRPSECCSAFMYVFICARWIIYHYLLWCVRSNVQYVHSAQSLSLSDSTLDSLRSRRTYDCIKCEIERLRLKNFDVFIRLHRYLRQTHFDDHHQTNPIESFQSRNLNMTPKTHIFLRCVAWNGFTLLVKFERDEQTIAWAKCTSRNNVSSERDKETHLYTHEKCINTVIYIHLLCFKTQEFRSKDISRYDVMCQRLLFFIIRTSNAYICERVNVYLVQLNLRYSLFLSLIVWMPVLMVLLMMMNVQNWWIWVVYILHITYHTCIHRYARTRVHKYLYIVIEQLCAIRNIKACTRTQFQVSNTTQRNATQRKARRASEQASNQ